MNNQPPRGYQNSDNDRMTSLRVCLFKCIVIGDLIRSRNEEKNSL